MEKTIEKLTGDTEGVSYEFPVFRFVGSDRAAPRAYLQAALHAGELPGTVAIDALMPKLAKAEAEGRIRGSHKRRSPLRPTMPSARSFAAQSCRQPLLATQPFQQQQVALAWLLQSPPHLYLLLRWLPVASIS